VIPIELVLSLSTGNIALKILNRVLAFVTWMMPGLFGYQVMFVARSAPQAAGLVSPQAAAE
jgi:hypothetical protein